MVQGNVVTGEMVEELILSGADLIKVGIGPGLCAPPGSRPGSATRSCQPSSNAPDAAHGLGGQIVGDGGCACPGDVAKAFGGGADFVMLGGMLAAHEESGGSIIERDGRRFMQFYGMSSAIRHGQTCRWCGRISCFGR